MFSCKETVTDAEKVAILECIFGHLQGHILDLTSKELQRAHLPGGSAHCVAEFLCNYNVLAWRIIGAFLRNETPHGAFHYFLSMDVT